MLGVWMVAYHRASIDKILTIILLLSSIPVHQEVSMGPRTSNSHDVEIHYVHFVLHIVSFKPAPLDSVT